MPRLGIAQLNTTIRVSLTNAGLQATTGGSGPSLSSDGRYVAFGSDASNLVAGDTNGGRDIFVRDRIAPSTQRVSLGIGGAQANGESYLLDMSADSRYVAFESDATNLVGADTNAETDIFVRDRTLGITTRISVSSLGALAFYATGALSVVPVGTAAGFGWGLGLLGLACALVVLEVARRGDTAVVRALELAPLRWVGRLSYAMYLVHVPMIDVARAVYLVEPRAQGAAEVLGVFVLALALTLVVAQALHVVVERPFLRLKDRFAG